MSQAESEDNSLLLSAARIESAEELEGLDGGGEEEYDVDEEDLGLDGEDYGGYEDEDIDGDGVEEWDEQQNHRMKANGYEEDHIDVEDISSNNNNIDDLGSQSIDGLDQELQQPSNNSQRMNSINMQNHCDTLQANSSHNRRINEKHTHISQLVQDNEYSNPNLKRSIRNSSRAQLAEIAQRQTKDEEDRRRQYEEEQYCNQQRIVQQCISEHSSEQHNNHQNTSSSQKPTAPTSQQAYSQQQHQASMLSMNQFLSEESFLRKFESEQQNNQSCFPALADRMMSQQQKAQQLHNDSHRQQHNEYEDEEKQEEDLKVSQLICPKQEEQAEQYQQMQQQLQQQQQQQLLMQYSHRSRSSQIAHIEQISASKNLELTPRQAFMIQSAIHNSNSKTKSQGNPLHVHLHTTTALPQTLPCSSSSSNPNQEESQLEDSAETDLVNEIAYYIYSKRLLRRLRLAHKTSRTRQLPQSSRLHLTKDLCASKRRREKEEETKALLKSTFEGLRDYLITKRKKKQMLQEVVFKHYEKRYIRRPLEAWKKQCVLSKAMKASVMIICESVKKHLIVEAFERIRQCSRVKSRQRNLERLIQIYHRKVEGTGRDRGLEVKKGKNINNDEEENNQNKENHSQLVNIPLVERIPKIGQVQSQQLQQLQQQYQHTSRSSSSCQIRSNSKQIENGRSSNINQHEVSSTIKDNDCCHNYMRSIDSSSSSSVSARQALHTQYTDSSQIMQTIDVLGTMKYPAGLGQYPMNAVSKQNNHLFTEESSYRHKGGVISDRRSIDAREVGKIKRQVSQTQVSLEPIAPVQQQQQGRAQKDRLLGVLRGEDRIAQQLEEQARMFQQLKSSIFKGQQKQQQPFGMQAYYQQQQQCSQNRGRQAQGNNNTSDFYEQLVEEQVEVIPIRKVSLHCVNQRQLNDNNDNTLNLSSNNEQDEYVSYSQNNNNQRCQQNNRNGVIIDAVANHNRSSDNTNTMPQASGVYHNNRYGSNRSPSPCVSNYSYEEHKKHREFSQQITEATAAAVKQEQQAGYLPLRKNNQQQSKEAQLQRYPINAMEIVRANRTNSIDRSTVNTKITKKNNNNNSMISASFLQHLDDGDISQISQTTAAVVVGNSNNNNTDNLNAFSKKMPPTVPYKNYQERKQQQQQMHLHNVQPSSSHKQQGQLQQQQQSHNKSCNDDKYYNQQRQQQQQSSSSHRISQDSHNNEKSELSQVGQNIQNILYFEAKIRSKRIARSQERARNDSMELCKKLEHLESYIGKINDELAHAKQKKGQLQRENIRLRGEQGE